MPTRWRVSWLLLAFCVLGPAVLALAGDSSPSPVTGVYRVLGTSEDGSHYVGMATATEAGGVFTFRRWVGQQAFTATGRFNDGKMVVNWDGNAPVTYTLGVAGNLRGSWENSKASEVLKLYLHATNPSLKEGTYNVTGRSLRTGNYKGVVTIARKGTGYTLEWKTGDERKSGEGTLESNTLTVSWGGTTPVIYAATVEGNLRGLWDAGAAEESLTPQ